MADIEILSTEETDEGYRCEVAVDEAGHRTHHVVTLSSADYERWSDQGMSPAAVVRRSLGLLLQRVSRDKLMERFDVRDTMQFYPAFEDGSHRSL